MGARGDGEPRTGAQDVDAPAARQVPRLGECRARPAAAHHPRDRQGGDEGVVLPELGEHLRAPPAGQVGDADPEPVPPLRGRDTARHAQGNPKPKPKPKPKPNLDPNPEVLWRERCARLIQRVFRGRRARLVARDRRHVRRLAQLEKAALIQRWYRQQLEVDAAKALVEWMRNERRKKKRVDSAVQMQTIARAWRARGVAKKLRRAASERTRAVTRIQSFIRRRQAQKSFRYTKKAAFASVVIQTRMRRLRAKRETAQRREATQTLTARAKSWLLKLEAKRELKRRRARAQEDLERYLMQLEDVDVCEFSDSEDETETDDDEDEGSIAAIIRRAKEQQAIADMVQRAQEEVTRAAQKIVILDESGAQAYARGFGGDVPMEDIWRVLTGADRAAAGEGGAFWGMGPPGSRGGSADGAEGDTGAARDFFSGVGFRGRPLPGRPGGMDAFGEGLLGDREAHGRGGGAHCAAAWGDGAEGGHGRHRGGQQLCIRCGQPLEEYNGDGEDVPEALPAAAPEEQVTMMKVGDVMVFRVPSSRVIFDVGLLRPQWEELAKLRDGQSSDFKHIDLGTGSAPLSVPGLALPAAGAVAREEKTEMESKVPASIDLVAESVPGAGLFGPSVLKRRVPLAGDAGGAQQLPQPPSALPPPGGRRTDLLICSACRHVQQKLPPWEELKRLLEEEIKRQAARRTIERAQLRARQQRCACEIQRWYRDQKKRQEDKGATMLATAARAFFARKEVRQRRERHRIQTKNALVLQCFARKGAASRAFHELQQKRALRRDALFDALRRFKDPLLPMDLALEGLEWPAPVAGPVFAERRRVLIDEILRFAREDGQIAQAPGFATALDEAAPTVEVAPPGGGAKGVPQGGALTPAVGSDDADNAADVLDFGNLLPPRCGQLRLGNLALRPKRWKFRAVEEKGGPRRAAAEHEDLCTYVSVDEV